MKKRVCFITALILCTLNNAASHFKYLFHAMMHHRSVCGSLFEHVRYAPDAQSIDEHLLSRFFKEVNNVPVLLVVTQDADLNFIDECFPNAAVFIAPTDMHSALIADRIKMFVQEQAVYSVVLIDTPGASAIIDLVKQASLGAGCFSIAGLCDQSLANAGHIDLQKLKKLMKQKVHIICTAALLSTKFEERRDQYMRGLMRIWEFGYEPYIVEPCVEGPTFLDHLSRHVLYSKSNNWGIINKGINELKSMQLATQRWSFDDDDMIIKITGRYFFENDRFIRFIEDSPDVDCAAKFDRIHGDPFPDNDGILTGCFAMRFGLLKKMLADIDYDKLERELIWIEHEVGPYLLSLEKQGRRFVHMEKLHVEANVFYLSGSDIISHW